MNEVLTADLTTIALSVLLLLTALVIVDRLLRFALRRLMALPGMQTQADAIGRIQRRTSLALVLLALVASVALIGGGAWLIGHGEKLPAWVMTQLLSIPPGFWLGLLSKTLQLALLGVVVAIARRVVTGVLAGFSEWAKKLDQLEANDAAIEHVCTSLATDLGRALWVAAAAVAARLLSLPVSVIDMADAGLRIALVIVAALAVWRALDVAIETLNAMGSRYADEKDMKQLYERASVLLPVLRVSLEYAIYVSAVTIGLHQVSTTAPFAGYGLIGLRLIGLFLLTRIVVELAEFAVRRRLIERADLSPIEKQRRTTIVPIVSAVVRYAAYFMAGVFACTELGVNPGPILAGAGIVGLAVSLGAQKIINDTVSGVLILFEDQFLVGDYIAVEGTGAEGVVQLITFRTTVLRDLAGRVHVLRNGDLRHVINYSSEWANAIVELRLDFETRLDRVGPVIERVGAEVMQRHEHVLEAPRWVIADLAEEFVLVKVITKVAPGQHISVARVLRKELYDAFAQEGLDLYFVRRVRLEGQEPG